MDPTPGSHLIQESNHADQIFLSNLRRGMQVIFEDWQKTYSSQDNELGFLDADHLTLADAKIRQRIMNGEDISDEESKAYREEVAASNNHTRQEFAAYEIFQELARRQIAKSNKIKNEDKK